MIRMPVEIDLDRSSIDKPAKLSDKPFMNPKKTPRFSDSDFVKSSYCTSTPGGCVEVATKDGITAIRDSNNPDDLLIFTADEWQVFIKGVKAGEFNGK